VADIRARLQQNEKEDGDAGRHHVPASFRRKLKGNLHHMIGMFDPEATDGVFTWEHVLMVLQQQYQHATEDGSQSVDAHPLLHPLRPNPETMQRIQQRVALLCGDPAANHSNFDKVYPAASTDREVSEMVQTVEVGHHFDWIGARSAADRSGADAGGSTQEIVIELPNV
jgi:hypothetical protein